MRKIKVLFFLLLAFITVHVNAQNASWYYDKPIKKIVFEGLVNVKLADITPVTNQFLGKQFSESVYMDIINAIYSLEKFDNDIVPEALPFDENQSGIILRFTVKEFPVITKIVYKGNKQVKTSELKDAVKVKELDVLNQKNLSSDERAVRNVYLDKGFTNVRVSSKTETKEDGDVILTFIISEGMATVVKDIAFEGNNIIASKTLKSKLNQKIRSVFNKGYFQESNIEQDRQVILQHYLSRGYIDAVVDENVKREVHLNEEDKREEITLTYYIKEGACYTYSGIEFYGNTIFSSKELNSCIKLKVGDIFNQLKFQEGIGAIVDLYYENGYTFNNFIPKPELDTAKREVFYSLQIIENDRAHIENIIVKGNKKTKEYVVSREIPLESGDIFSKSKLTSGIRNLNSLQYFSSVYPQIIPGSEENLVDLIINVEEQSTTSVEFGLTFSGVTETSKIPISLFAKWQESNFLGTGRTLASQLSISNTEQSIGIGYGDSWFLNRPLNFNVSANFYHRELTTLQYLFLPGSINSTNYYMDYTNWTTSFSSSLGRRWTPPFAILILTGGIGFNLLNNVYDSNIFKPVDSIIRENCNNWGWTNNIFLSFSMDDRDVAFDPKKGWFFSERITWTGLIPKVEKQFFLRNDLKLEGYYPLANIPVSEKWSFILVLAGYSGFTFQVPTKDSQIGSSNKLYIDGMFNGRGWNNIASIKGQVMWSNYVELRWSFLPGLFALDFFFDAVYLQDSVSNLSKMNIDDWRFSFGPGLRVCMAQFPLRFMLASAFKFKDGQFQWNKGNGAVPLDFVLSFNLVNK
ncbi:MAG: outer membrane protein assembly factor BamA [Treponemataceae bacterium]